MRQTMLNMARGLMCSSPPVFAQWRLSLGCLHTFSKMLHTSGISLTSTSTMVPTDVAYIWYQLDKYVHHGTNRFRGLQVSCSMRQSHVKYL